MNFGGWSHPRFRRVEFYLVRCLVALVLGRFRLSLICNQPVESMSCLVGVHSGRGEAVWITAIAASGALLPGIVRVVL
jgi:hypothetical protein